ncbi:MAG: SRPBCC family protein, partial [Nitriliruptoraceae bacterium]|nr:SRPBCC family protein [Nitriliruptoraceae bacterium]
MARITEELLVPLSPEQAFDHVADFTTSAQWDPQITRAERLDVGGFGLGSRFRVSLALGPVRLPLVYEITTYDRPHRVVLTTRGPVHVGEDDVTFEATDEGTRVVWNALFRLRGPGRLMDPALGVGFRRAPPPGGGGGGGARGGGAARGGAP